MGSIIDQQGPRYLQLGLINTLDGHEAGKVQVPGVRFRPRRIICNDERLTFALRAAMGIIPTFIHYLFEHLDKIKDENVEFEEGGELPPPLEIDFEVDVDSERHDVRLRWPSQAW